MKAGFAQAEITPPLGSPRVGWGQPIAVERVLDPLYAKVCLLECDGRRVGFISLDTLSVRWSMVKAIRAIADRYGWPGDDVQVSATHNHAGPAVVSVGPVQRDDALVRQVRDGVERAFALACDQLQPAEIGFAQGIQDGLTFCRRGVMRDGSTRCHPVAGPDYIHSETVPDPSVGVICLRNRQGQTLGTLVNFACHPTHFGGDPVATAGWPGQLAKAVAQQLGPQCVTLLLNGAFGDLFHRNHLDPDHHETMESFGQTLGKRVIDLINEITFIEHCEMSVTSQTITLPRRDVDGPFGINQPFPQRFLKPNCYPKMYEKLRQRRAELPNAYAELQLIEFVGHCRVLGVPAEPFCAVGLNIKRATRPVPIWIVGAANGMVGYLPTAQAFHGGGYECTLATSSKLDPQAADVLQQAAIDMIEKQAKHLA